MTKDEINLILDKHYKYLSGEDGGERANLRGADLRGANLRGADLRGANLRDANLCGANLCGANLRDANLWDANLCGANLCGADLRDANLCGANLCGANLRDANLRGANLCGANLRDANLRGANLWGLMGEGDHIKTIFLETYQITYTSKYLQIGCQRHRLEEWWDFDDDAINAMDSRAVEFWSKWKDWLKGTIEKSPALPTKEESPN